MLRYFLSKRIERTYKENMNDENDRLNLELDAYKQYAKSLRQQLDKENYTVFKPILRHFTRFTLRVLDLLPKSVLYFAVKWKNKLYKNQIVPDYGDPAIGAMQYINVSDSDKLLSDFQSLCLSAKNKNFDIILFPIIDWEFRIQRPQQLCQEFAKEGIRVIYMSTNMEVSDKPGFSVYSSPADNVFLCKLHSDVSGINIHGDILSKGTSYFLKESLSILQSELNVGRSVSLLQHPFWYQINFALIDSSLVYDCIDYHQGFDNNHNVVKALEEPLIRNSDLVTVSSEWLYEKVKAIRNSVDIIRNGTDFTHFSQIPITGENTDKVTIGYVGAISDWFDMELLVSCADYFDEWNFVLVGSTYGADLKQAQKCTNIIFEGEQPYEQLPKYLNDFDVCIIPFKSNELTQCTNPVKVYEYLSAGKPVVATQLPEVMLMGDMVFSGEGVDEFKENLVSAVNISSDIDKSMARRLWAEQHSWNERCKQFISIFQNKVNVSIVILSYNNIEYTKACLLSIAKYSQYENYEVIIVDNGSSVTTVEQLKSIAQHDVNLSLIINQDNLGFAKGNNIGIKAAKGEFIILLNNDTIVSAGWLNRFIHHMTVNPQIGLLGPVTNNIGNEAKIDISYSNVDDGLELARKYTLENANILYYTSNLAFFCVVIRRSVINKVGLLDEEFGRGFFEDDDYCIRALNEGFQVAIADDVFVHHQLSASFDKIDSVEREALFNKNKAYFEEKWGKWRAHPTTRNN